MQLKSRSCKAASLLILGLILGPNLIQDAWASDLAEPSILRGTDDDDMFMESPPPRYNKWAGFYIGGQASYVQGTISFGDSLTNLLTTILASTPYAPIVDSNADAIPLQSKSAHSAGYGGFIGYNWNFNGTLIGFELEYSSANLKAITQNSTPQKNTVLYDEQVNGAYGIRFAQAASIAKVENMGSFRFRGGFSVGNFLPYGFLGLAVGQGSTKNVVVVQEYQYVVPEQVILGPGGTTVIQGTPFNQPITGPYLLVDQQTHAVYWWGYTIGAGTEINFTDNIFARLEYSFTALDSTTKTGQPQINKVTGGLGFRF